MDLQKYRDGKLLLQANTGGGKSYAMRRIIEQSFDSIPQIILDTEGEFANLRQKYDFLLIGKGYEIAADPKTAALLAHRLIEARVSAVIDLFEMSVYDRELFVKNFVTAMTNAPKHLWLPTILVVDEAQTYAPEGERTECSRALYDAAFKFRKRHFGMIFATPRISALSKNIISTCKNKLIGYTSFEGDVKRAAYELGFSTKDEWRSLRDLEPGQFFAFGNAISREVIKINIGEVKTAHGDEETVNTTVAPPSAKLLKALAKLADLPQAAAEEAKTLAEFKVQLANARREITMLKSAPKEGISSEDQQKIVEKAVKDAELRKDRELAKWYSEFEKQSYNWIKTLTLLMEAIQGIKKFEVIEMVGKTIFKSPDESYKRLRIKVPEAEKLVEMLPQRDLTAPPGEDESKDLSKCARAIASYLISDNRNEPGAWRTKTQVAIATGYSQKSSGFSNAISELKTKGMIAVDGKNLNISATSAQFNVERIDPSPEKWKEKLGMCPRKIWEFLWSQGFNTPIQKYVIAEQTGYSVTSSGFSNAISELSSLGLIERVGKEQIMINSEIQNL